MDATRVKALASELELTLRLLAQLMRELKSRRDEWVRSGVVRELVSRLAAQPDLVELPAVLLRAHAEITEILGGIRLTRAAVEAYAVERIRDTQHKVSAVTSTTESATLGITHSLLDLETRVTSVAALFDHAFGAPGVDRLPPRPDGSSSHLAFNPDATVQRSTADPAMIDEAFKGAWNGAPSQHADSITGS